MASRDRETLKDALQKKGFRLKTGDHIYFIYYSQDGKKTSVHTKISRGSKYKVLTDNLLAQMSKQCKLPKSDFLGLIDCPLTQKAYEEKLLALAIIS
jgi:hypothetical protein